MVREGYVGELRKSFDLLLCFVLPCFLAECAYKIWWYCYCAGRIPFMRNHLARKVMACVFELWSWTYRTSTFFLLCVLFHLVCHLQILRLQDFASAFQDDKTNVALILKEHLRIRRKLRVISHRFRVFIVVCLVIVTVSLFATLLVATRSHAEVNFFTSGELAGGNLYDSDNGIPFEDATKDTHLTVPRVNNFSFQQRQALVTYLENNRAGITVFGCMMDRAWLHAVFGVEFALVLWLLGKTVGI
ncbi:hypothetical protein QJS10_CPB15g01482 [Acorus calamus]|uniref:Uncharacterized protein n=1 Tax=Acorus calamus TaxID=4465 RepID=A0AAV9DC47_ACOCL|nr:hypothetical protein QJS10_CPB15g01482 [Acorus calamus]